MSWYTVADLPEQVVESITVQGWDKSGSSWSCGCMAGQDGGDALVWFCKYHEGYYDGIREGQR